MSAAVALPAVAGDRRRWIALVVVCLAQLMNVLDTTAVNVALPQIQRNLHFTQAELTWVVASYLISFSGLMLFAGRLGDLAGRKRVFLGGILLFTLASLACALAQDKTLLIAARFIQGIGGAASTAAAMAVIVTEFPEPIARAKAMSAYMFVAVSGGSIGLLVGGALTQSAGWHWIFFINIPVGIATLAAGAALIKENVGLGLRRGIDVAGSVLVTAALMIGVYAIVDSTRYGWSSAHTVGFGFVALSLLATFALLERRLANPIMPPRIFAVPGLVTAALLRALVSMGMFATFFLGGLYVQRVLRHDPFQTGLAFMPMTIGVALVSTGFTARMVKRFGAKRTLLPSMALMVAGLVLLATATPRSGYFPTIFVSFLLLGLSNGLAAVPLMTTAVARVAPADAGLASGMVQVSLQFGSAIGLALLSTIASAHTNALLAHGHALAGALTAGYDRGYAIAAACIAVGIPIAAFVLPSAMGRAARREGQGTEIAAAEVEAAV